MSIGSYILTATPNSSANFSWNDVTGSTQTLAAGNGYVTDRAGGVVYTLPSTANIGYAIAIMGKLGSWSISQNANQQILLGTQSSTIGVNGSLSSTSISDCVELECITAGTSTVWRVRNFSGSPTIV